MVQMPRWIRLLFERPGSDLNISIKLKNKPKLQHWRRRRKKVGISIMMNRKTYQSKLFKDTLMKLPECMKKQAILTKLQFLKI
jgi:hypothetical protein